LARELLWAPFSGIAMLLWVCEGFEAAGDDAEMKLLFHLDSASEGEVAIPRVE
jgi:hypothetical protein